MLDVGSRMERIYSGENETAEESKFDYGAEKASIKNSNMRRTAKLREESAKAVYKYLVSYSLFSALVIALQGFHLFGFLLPDTALCILIGSTAVSAIGLVAIVLRGLFPPQTKRGSK